jgi:hypothetical protein
MTPASILNGSAAPGASLDYGQQIHCVVIKIHRPLFHKWRLTDGILLFLWLAVERLLHVEEVISILGVGKQRGGKVGESLVDIQTTSFSDILL